MLPSHTYHIYNHANGGDNLFRSPENYNYFLRKWKEYIDPVGETIAYCLMPNHFHMMVEIKVGELLVGELSKKRKLDLNNLLNLRGLSEVEVMAELRGNRTNETTYSTKDLEGFYKILSVFIIQQFSNFFNAYTKAINKRYRRYGSLFAPTFRRIPVTTDVYARRLIRYIHANPVHHGFCMKTDEWPHSSYASYFVGHSEWKNLSICKYFEKPEEFQQWHNQIDTGTDEILEI